MGACGCGPKVEYQGSVFYRVIDDKLEKTGKPDIDEVFAKADDPLQQSEITRSKIANAFKEMTILTGTCVLKVPDLEQCIRAYLIKFLIELKLNSPTQGGSLDFDFSKLELNSMFTFSQTAPYISFDEKKLKDVQNIFKINPLEGELGKMKDSIVQFIKSLEGIKHIFDEYSKECWEIKEEAYEFISKLDVRDGMSELYRQVMIGKRNVQKILDMRVILEVIGEVGTQIAEAVNVFSSDIRDRSHFKKYEDLAAELVEKKITSDMKEIVWNTSNEAKLEKFEDWKNNFEYRPVGTIFTG